MGFLQKFRQNFFFTYCNSFSFFVPHLHAPSPQVPQLSHFLYSTYLTVFQLPDEIFEPILMGLEMQMKKIS